MARVTPSPAGGSGGSSVASQTGNAGKFLKTDGTSTSWASVVPNQTIVLAPSGDTTGATDQAAVAAALTSLASNSVRGGTLVLGGGDWYWSSQQIDIYTNPARIRIVGQGQATKIHSTATGTAGLTKALFYVNGGGPIAPFPGPVGTNWIDIGDMELVGNGSAVGIAYDGVFQGRIGPIYGHGFTASTMYGTPIWLNFCIEIDVVNPVCTGNYHGLYLQGNANNIHGGWLQGNSLTGAFLDSTSGSTTFWGTVFQGNVYGADVLSSYNTRFQGCWFEGNSLAAAYLRGITNNRGSVTHIYAPYLTGGGFLVSSTQDNVTLTSPWNTGSSPTITVTAGAKNICLVDPPSNMTAAQIQDGTLGAEFSIRRGKPAVNTVAASGTAVTIPTPHMADVNEITLTGNAALSFPVAMKGRSIDVTLTQDATGSRTVTWDASVIWAGGTAPTLTTTAGRSDRFRFTSDDGIYWSGSQLGLNFSPAGASGPLSVTGMLGWFDATKITSTDNSGLPSWTDLSRNGRDFLQEAATSRPTYYSSTSGKLINGKPAVYFNGANFMVSNAVGSNQAQPITVYLVCYVNSFTGGAYLLDGSPRLAVMNGTGTALSAYAGAEIDSAAGGAATGSRLVIAAVFNGASSVLRSNGVQIASGNTGANAFGSLTLGARAGGTVCFTGLVGEVLVYSGAHSGGTLTTIESYLTSKW